ncbi:hypothetical protein [Reichenbachiella sp. MALMAid0571]|uniref:hypothetical protein n=1 Tax=Reichenbachiella sp. MALMAid0571 TaxID=3143939 RepID=UPI0032DF5A68
MYIPFEEMSPTSRVWIYQADRQLSNQETNFIEDSAKQFLSEWSAHGNPLKSSFSVFHSKFLVISVDENYNQASGCSIDASVGLIRNLENKLNLNFFDRTKVAFLLNGEIFQSAMHDLKSLILDGKISSETITFNNLVENIDQFRNEWKVPAGETWLKRYF